MNRLMAMVAAAVTHLEWRTGEPENDEEHKERDGDSSTYEIRIGDGCWTAIYYYDGGQAGITVAPDERPDDDPAAVAIGACDRARDYAMRASPW